MKKILIALLLAVVQFFENCACQPSVIMNASYTGNRPELFAMGMYSVPFAVNDGAAGVSTYVVEKDAYGRELFIMDSRESFFYYGENRKSSKSWCYAIMICQKTEGNCVYFYEDSFIAGPLEEAIADDKHYIEKILRENEKAVSALKAENDWNQALKEENMIRCKVESSVISYSASLKAADEEMLKKSLEDHVTGRLQLRLFGTDSSGQTVYYFSSYGDGKHSEHGLVMVDREGDYDSSDIRFLEDFWNVADDIRDFKKEKNWVIE